MRRRRSTIGLESGTITGIAEVTGERVRWNHEEAQRKFRMAVLAFLSKIEVKLAEVQAAQLADFWRPERVTDEKRKVYLGELEERMSKASNELGLRMVKHIYGFEDEPVPGPRRGKRRHWSDWEI